jgi:hypothetical protein
VNGWMKRRIERSRARCDKPATNPKPDRPQQVTKQTSAQDAQPAQPATSS